MDEKPRQSETEVRKKKVYRRPRLECVELVAEEVMGIGCESIANPFTDQPGCGPGGPCSQATS